MSSSLRQTMSSSHLRLGTTVRARIPSTCRHTHALVSLATGFKSVGRNTSTAIGFPRSATTRTLSRPLPFFTPPSNHARTYRWIAEAQETYDPKGKQKQGQQQGQSPSGTPVDLGESERHLTNAEQRKKDWDIVKKLMVNIWPRGNYNVKSRVIVGFGLLVAGKVRLDFRILLGEG